MNAAKLHEAIKIAADYALEVAPIDLDARARIFVAALSGRIAIEEPALSAVVFGVLERPAADTIQPLADA